VRTVWWEGDLVTQHSWPQRGEIHIIGNTKTRQTMCVSCAIDVRSCNHGCSRKAKKYYIFWVCVYSLRYPACNARTP